jgi:hypothetical protein
MDEDEGLRKRERLVYFLLEEGSEGYTKLLLTIRCI